VNNLDNNAQPLDVSVVIVNWNTRDILRDCLASVFAETKGLSFEVIVVDNGSTDGSVEMVRREFSQAILIANTENKGFGAANNEGIRWARGGYVLLLNSDTVILSRAIPEVVRFADQHPDVGAVGCRVLTQDRIVSQNCIGYPSLLNLALGLLRLDQLFPRHPFFDRERMGAWMYDSVREVPALAGCFVLLRAGAFRQVGGFDERYFMYYEDIDLCRRLKLARWRIMFFPGAEIIHFHGASSRLMRDRMVLEKRRSLLLFLADAEGTGIAWLANVMCLIGTLARMPFWLLEALRNGTVKTNRPTTVRTMVRVVLFHARGLLWPYWGQGRPPTNLCTGEAPDDERPMEHTVAQ
jgi:GT2 family glycosyltransferase